MAGFVCGFWYLCVWQSQRLLDTARGSMLEDLLVNYVSSTTRFHDSEDTPINYMIRRRGEPRNFAAERKARWSNQLLNNVNKTNHQQDAVDGRYIIFRPTLLGQGAGNVVHGLLAVHALAEEFDRIVCHPQYKEFNTAFQHVDSQVTEACRKLASDRSAIEIRMVNYEGPGRGRVYKAAAAAEVIVYSPVPFLTLAEAL